MAASVAAASGSSLSSLIYEAASRLDSPVSPEALSTKEVTSYIRSLSNLSLSDLRTQPQQLQTKSEALHRQLSELCISQTDAFIHIHQAEQQFAPSLTTLATHLGDLINNTLPELQKAADAFAEASKPVLEERKRVQNVADQYERGHLSDLLEIPPLVQTCVRAGHHSEAIQLAEHLIGLLTRLPTANDTASEPNKTNGQCSTYLSLLIETLSHLATVKADLIASFSRTGLKLPAARKSVTTLRKLTYLQSLLPQISDWNAVLASPQSKDLIPALGMNENQLCLAFLKARIRSFHSALDAMGSPSSFTSEAYLRRYIDLWRDEMADTLSMAFSIFIDEPVPDTSREQGTVTPAYLLASFAASGLERLRDTVSAQLTASTHRVSSTSDSIDPASSLEGLAETFSSVHTQLSYASASLSRFGFDFGQLLFAPDPNTALSSIETLWLETLSSSLDQAFAFMHEQIDHHVAAADLPSSWLISSQLTSTALEDLYNPSERNTELGMYDDYSRPNIELVDYPPLAKLLNRLLGWVNALQSFAPTSLARPLMEKLDRHLALVTDNLITRLPEVISSAQPTSAHKRKLLADSAAQSHLAHLDEASALEAEIVRDRESIILGKVVRMWHASVVTWLSQVVAFEIFDGSANMDGNEAEKSWAKAQEWIAETEERVAKADKVRKEDAEERKRVADEAETKAKAEAEEKARAEEEARLKAEAEAKAKAKAEDEARLLAEAEAKEREEARIKAEAEARAKADAEAKAAAEAKARAEEEARIKAEAEAKTAAEAEAKAKAEEDAQKKAAEEELRVKAEEEARVKAEEEARIKSEAEAKAKAEEEAKLKAEQEAQLRVDAEARAKEEAEADAKAKAMADEQARLAAEEQAAKAKAEDEAKKQEDAQPQTAPEPAAAPVEKEAAKTSAQETPAPAAAPKKFSLADKLRQRKEERDRAAAAAAASGSSADAPVAKEDIANSSAQRAESSAKEDDEPKATNDSAAQAEAKTEAKEGPKEDAASSPIEQTATDNPRGEANQDEEGDEGEDEGDGADTPATGSVPSTPNLGGGGVGKKKNKKKNKKKK